MNSTKSIYIKLKSHPSVCLSATPITTTQLLTSTNQLPHNINPSSSYFKFVNTSESGDQMALCSGLKTKKWRKLEQHFMENNSHMAQWVEQLTCIQEVVGSNTAREQIFFENQYFLHTHFLKSSFDNTVTWHSKHALKRDLSEIEHTSSGKSNLLIAN